MARLRSGPPGSDEPEARGPLIEPGTWTVDRSSTVGFVARQFLVHRVRGTFGSFRASMDVRPDLWGSTIVGEVDTVSVQTGDHARDEHLRSADFFDAARWPTMRLEGQVTGPGPRGYTAAVALTIRDVTRPVTFDVRLRPPSGEAATLAAVATATVNRKDFGLRWSSTIETGGVVVSDHVELVLEIAARRAQS